MAAVAYGESGGDPTAVQQGQPAATTGWGLWQITPGTSEPQVGTNNALLDPLTNAKAAVAKMNDSIAAGQSPMQPWGGGTSDPIGQTSINQGGPLSLATAEALAQSVHGGTIDYSNAIDTSGGATQAQLRAFFGTIMGGGTLSSNVTVPSPDLLAEFANYMSWANTGPGSTLTNSVPGVPQAESAWDTLYGSATTIEQDIQDTFDFLTNPKGWVRIGEGFLALGLVIFGSILFFKSTATGQRVEGAATSAATAAAV
jgi:hypothetical protein